MKNILSKKLSLMIFLHFFAMGSVVPVLSLYLLNELHFTGAQVGMVLAVGAISSIVSPFVSSFIADKVISSERLFAVGHFFGSLMMLLLFFNQKFIAILFGYMAYQAFVGPTMPLADTIIFHHISDRKKYGNIRVWGTIGWISVALFFGMFVITKTGSFKPAFLVSALSSFGLAVFVFSIPKTKVEREKNPQLLPIESLRILMKPEVLILTLMTFMIYFADRFYFYGSSPYLKSIGIAEKFILPFLSIGQILEIVAMVSLGRLLTKFRPKYILILGIFINMVRYSLLMLTGSKIMTIFAIACHGMAYTFIFSTVFILVDYKSDKKSRAGVHQLFRIIYLGFGTFLGNIAAGYIQDNYNISNDYNIFWLVPAIISLTVLIIMIFYPTGKKSTSQ